MEIWQMVRSATSPQQCQRQAARMETSRVRRLPDESCNSWPSSDSELGPTTKAASKEAAFFGVSASTLEDEASKSTQRMNFPRTCCEASRPQVPCPSPNLKLAHHAFCS